MKSNHLCPINSWFFYPPRCNPNPWTLITNLYFCKWQNPLGLIIVHLSVSDGHSWRTSMARVCHGAHYEDFELCQRLSSPGSYWGEGEAHTKAGGQPLLCQGKNDQDKLRICCSCTFVHYHKQSASIKMKVSGEPSHVWPICTILLKFLLLGLCRNQIKRFRFLLVSVEFPLHEMKCMNRYTWGSITLDISENANLNWTNKMKVVLFEWILPGHG